MPSVGHAALNVVSPSNPRACQESGEHDASAVAFCVASAEYAQAMLSGSGRHSATMMIVAARDGDICTDTAGPDCFTKVTSFRNRL
jgi:hypothetical protein